MAKVWKAKINENAKCPAFFNEFPELNHNEMVGFTRLNGNYYVIMMEDEEDHERIKRRMEVTKGLLQKQGCPVLLMKITGKDRLARIFSTVLLGSYVGYYLALEHGVDPTPVTMVEDLKKTL
jgi:glucose/mannose-6-phosphate isomerase